MKRRFEIYLGEEEFQLIELLKIDTGQMKPGRAITAAIHSYFRYQETIKRLTSENIRLKNKLSKYE